jgi:hypothetical protein
VKGNKYERVIGNYILEVQGDFTKTVIGDDSTSVGGDANLLVSPTGTGKFRITTGEAGSAIQSTLFVDGEVQATSISSKTSFLRTHMEPIPLFCTIRAYKFNFRC